MIIGLDVGGTHTDVVLLGRDGLQKEIKVPTDPSDLFQSVLCGLNAITEDIDPSDINRIVLSTTLTTNAIVQNKIPPVGMIAFVVSATARADLLKVYKGASILMIAIILSTVLIMIFPELPLWLPSRMR